MSTKRVNFKKTDVMRAVVAVRSAGLDVERVEIDVEGKKITVVPGAPANDATDDPWGRGHAQNQKRTA